MVSAAFTLTDTMRGAANSLSVRRLRRHRRGRLRAHRVQGRQRERLHGAEADGRRLGPRPGPRGPAGRRRGRRHLRPGPDHRPRRQAASAAGPYFGTGFDSRTPGAEKLTAFRLQDGRWATGPGEVVIDVATAEKRALQARLDRVKITTRGAASSFRVVGLARFGTVKSLGTGDDRRVRPRAPRRQLFHKQGRYDSVLVAGKPGTSGADVRRAVAAAVGPAPRSRPPRRRTASRSTA